jgi:hypothetical protein
VAGIASAIAERDYQQPEQLGDPAAATGWSFQIARDCASPARASRSGR